jgi:ABC-type multidrug transport system ATPase subunit
VIRTWFRGDGSKGNRGILILGPGGVGKTTLARILAGEYDFLLESPGEYDESIGIERYTLADAPKVNIVVSPGQEIRRAAT